MRLYITLLFVLFFSFLSAQHQQNYFDSLYNSYNFGQLYHEAKQQVLEFQDDYLAWKYFGLAAEKQYLYKEALNAYDQVLKYDSVDYTSLIGKYRIYKDSKDFNNALAIAYKMDSILPDQLSTIYNIAFLNNKLEKFDEAISWCDTALKQNPGFEKALDLKAHSLLANKDSTRALDLWIGLFRHYPRDQYSRQLAYIGGSHNYADSILRVLTHRSVSDSTNANLYKMIAFMHYKNERFSSASNHLRVAMILGDSSIFTYHYLGLSSFQEGDYSTACQSLEKVPDFKQDPMLLYIYAMSHARVFSDTTSVNLLNNAFDAFYKNMLFANIHNELGETAKKIGERYLKRVMEETANEFFQLSEKSYKKANQFNKSISNDLGLAILYDLYASKPKQALAIYNNCIEQLPDTSSQRHKFVKSRIKAVKEMVHFLDE